MEEETVKITKQNLKSFQKNLPLAIQLRSKQRKAFTVRFYRCKDMCGFTYKVKEFINTDEIEIILSSRSCHQDRVIPNQESSNTKGPVLKEIKESIINLVEIHKYFTV